MNNKGFVMSTMVYGAFILFILLLSILILSMSSSLKLLRGKVNTVNNYELVEEDHFEEPDISNGLTPVKYVRSESGESGNWIITNSSDPEWYNYEEQKWANAVILKNQDLEEGDVVNVDVQEVTDESSELLDIYAMFVWIPRFSYTIGCHESGKCYGYRLNDGTDNDYDLSSSFPGAIDIKFVTKDAPLEISYIGYSPTYLYDVNNTDKRIITNYYTHPAFWWDIDNDGVRVGEAGEELAGIWVGKFETSVSTTSSCYEDMIGTETLASCSSANAPRILPNVLSVLQMDIEDQFGLAKKFTSDTTYGINGDSHMMKNNEWGAVAYLSQSKYGKYGNSEYIGTDKEIFINNSGRYIKGYGTYWARYTGRSEGIINLTERTFEESIEISGYNYDDISNRGPGASTTGNIYGIYDMSGGAREYVMALEFNNNSQFGKYISDGDFHNSAGFTSTPEKMYFNGYQSYNILTKSSEVIGHATAETIGWYGDSSTNLTSGNNWVLRGGLFNSTTGNGIFSNSIGTGNSISSGTFRVVLTNN